MNINKVILLTACVNPKGMEQTALTDIEQRENQYIEALWYYLKTTDKKIVIVENSNSDFSAPFLTYIKEGRLEFLTFDGNNFDRKLGKGYGEMEILDYAVKNSVFIRNADYIIKITGRIIISNLNVIEVDINKAFKGNKQLIACDISFFYTFARSKIFFANKNFIENYLVKSMNRINDSKKVYFENVFAKMVYKWKRNGFQLHVFSIPVITKGQSGTTGKELSKPLRIQLISKKLKSIYFRYSPF